MLRACILVWRVTPKQVAWAHSWLDVFFIVAFGIFDEEDFGSVVRRGVVRRVRSTLLLQSWLMAIYDGSIW